VMNCKPVKIPLLSGPLVMAGRVLERLPLPFAPPITEYRARVVARDFWFSTKKAEDMLGYRPVFSVNEAVTRSVKWAQSLPNS